MPPSADANDSLAAAMPQKHTWTGRPLRVDLTSLPGGPALYLLIDEQGTPVQLATTQSLRRALVARLTVDEAGPARADLAAVTRGVRWRNLSCAFEGRWWYWRVARVLHPRDYRQRISFGPAWFLHVDWAQGVPELRVTESVWRAPGEYVGPWRVLKEAQEALEGLRDLFDLCRYPEQVRKAPQGKRCVYAEMRRCDAPCDGSVPLSAYVDRCRAAWAFARDGPATWLAAASGRMRAAAASRAYELAGQIKQQIGFAESWARRWGCDVGPVEELNRVIALPVTRRRAWKVFTLRSGVLSEGPIVAERRFAAEAAAWVVGERTARSALEEGAGAAPTHHHSVAESSSRGAWPRVQPAANEGESDPLVRMETTWLVAQLMFNRQRERAVMVPLMQQARSELEAQLREALGRARATPAADRRSRGGITEGDKAGNI